MIDASEDSVKDPATEEEGRRGEGGGSGGDGSSKGRLSDQAIVANSVTFLLGGYETTANTLAFTSYLLALHPDIQERLRTEIDDYFHSNPVSTNDGYSGSVSNWYVE